VWSGGGAAGCKRGGGGAGTSGSEKLGCGSTKGTGWEGANVNSFVADPSADSLSALNQSPGKATAAMITMQTGKIARNFERFGSSFVSNVPKNEPGAVGPKLTSIESMGLSMGRER
jgi:hypothetical protein